MKLNDLLRSLEDCGEVNYTLVEHKLVKDDAGNFDVKSLVPVCFVLDPVKNKRKKHKARLTRKRTPNDSLCLSGISVKVNCRSRYLLNGEWWSPCLIILSSLTLCLVQASGNALTFGAKMDFAKLRSCANIQLIWRLRPGFQKSICFQKRSPNQINLVS